MGRDRNCQLDLQLGSPVEDLPCISRRLLKNMVICWKRRTWIKRILERRCSSQVTSEVIESLILLAVLTKVAHFAGELERIFLVLREKVALRRLKARDGEGASGGAPGELPETAPAGPEPDQHRGQKRVASEGSNSPSKRPAL